MRDRKDPVDWSFSSPLLAIMKQNRSILCFCPKRTVTNVMLRR